MEQDNELQRLERFVENLLTRFSELRAEKAKCLEEIRERDEIISGLRDNISSKDVERDEIGSRVNRIVAQIEEWELNLEETVYEEVTPEMDDAAIESVEEDVQEIEPEATSEESTVTEQNGVDEEKRVQHNLFSMGTSSYDKSSE